MKLQFKVFLLLAMLATTSRAANWSNSATATGKVTCQMADGSIEPLKNVVVKLLDKDLVHHDLFGETRTREDGRFRVEGTGGDRYKPEPFIQVVYDYQGEYGHMEVVGSARVTRKFNTPVKKVPSNPYPLGISFGEIQISDDHCRAYVLFLQAMKDYYKRTGSKVPYSTLHIRTHGPIHGGTPWAIRSRVILPKGFEMNFERAKHELGHTVRQTLDGNLAHFLADAIRFRYMRQHDCSTKSNFGYAFNEGFAAFWAGQCPFWYGPPPYNDLTIEGNVATSLRLLQKSCGFTDVQMIDVLRENPKQIHSFQDFKEKSGCISPIV